MIRSSTIAALALLALPAAGLAQDDAPENGIAPFGVWSTPEGCAALDADGNPPPESPQGALYLDSNMIFWGVEDNCLILGGHEQGWDADTRALFLSLYCQAPGEHWPEVATAIVSPAGEYASLKIGSDPAAQDSWYEFQQCRDGSMFE